MNLAGVFVLIVNGELKTYNNYDDIPDDFDHVIRFEPIIPDPPHTQEQHHLIEEISNLFKILMDKEQSKYGISKS